MDFWVSLVEMPVAELGMVRMGKSSGVGGTGEVGERRLFSFVIECGEKEGYVECGSEGRNILLGGFLRT